MLRTLNKPIPESLLNYEDNENSTMNLADTSDDADVVSSHEPHLLVVSFSHLQSCARTQHMEHSGGPGGREPRSQKTGEPEKEHSAKEKGRGIGPNCPSGDTLQLSTYRTTREHKKQSDKHTRSCNLRWLVTDLQLCPTKTVKAHQLTNCPKDPS